VHITTYYTAVDIIIHHDVWLDYPHPTPGILSSDVDSFYDPAGWGLGEKRPLCAPPVATPLVVHKERNYYQKLLSKLDRLADAVCAPTSQAQVTKNGARRRSIYGRARVTPQSC